MTPDPITDPHDALEQAILDGAVWDMSTDPVQIDTFNTDEDVISVVVEKGQGVLHVDIKESRDGVQILANGRPMAHVAGLDKAFSMSNIRVLQPRTMG
ncbi:MAG: hypothetical protein AAFY25_07260 [Pseudomonadota bacterium]